MDGELLTGRQRLILELRFGLAGAPPTEKSRSVSRDYWSYGEIAKELDISTERASQIAHDGLRKVITLLARDNWSLAKRAYRNDRCKECGWPFIPGSKKKNSSHKTP